MWQLSWLTPPQVPCKTKKIGEQFSTMCSELKCHLDFEALKNIEDLLAQPG